MLIQGSMVALVTPMTPEGAVDWEAYARLLEWHIASGTDGIVTMGTTGESPTLDIDEHNEVVSFTVKTVAGRVPVIAGTGGNSTAEAIELTRHAKNAGADVSLQVVPYYNKPSQKGMIEHFSAVAGASDVPVILYNIPSRTGVNMLPETVACLAEKFSNIVALKQSSPDMDLISELKLCCPPDFAIYSGDDSLTLPMLSLGVHGVISVASHLFGSEIKSMIRNFKTGDVIASRNMHKTLFPIFKKLFMAPNPVPVKAALAHKGLIEEYLRRPLVELDEEQKSELFAVFDRTKAELAG